MSDGVGIGMLALILTLCILFVAEHIKNEDRRDHCRRCRDTLYRLSSAWRRIVGKP